MQTSVLKEIVLKGFDGSTDKTDELILWVKGDEGSVSKVLNKLGDKVQSTGSLEIDDSIDFILPEQESELIAEVEKLLSSHTPSITGAPVTNR